MNMIYEIILKDIEEADLLEDIERAGPLKFIFKLSSKLDGIQVLDKKLIKAISIFYSLSSENMYFEKLIGKTNMF